MAHIRLCLLCLAVFSFFHLKSFPVNLLGVLSFYLKVHHHHHLLIKTIEKQNKSEKPQNDFNETAKRK
jgi:hypothetical protein